MARLGPVSSVFPNLPRYTYFKSHTVYTGSKGDMRFRVEPFDEIKVYVWFGKKSFENSEIDIEKTFEQSEDGFEQMVRFLEDTAKSHPESEDTRFKDYKGWDYDFMIKHLQNELERRCNDELDWYENGIKRGYIKDN